MVMHKLFDNGEGRTTIAGGQGTMWTTLLQIGELIDTANRVYDPTETRVLVTHASPAREGLLNQLSVALKADFSISAGLHFRYGSSYNEFSVNPSLDHYRGKLSASKASFNDVWETVKHEVEPAVSENESQNKLLHYALELVDKMPAVVTGGTPFGGGPAHGQVDESAFKNMWNFNLADAAFGWLVLDIDQGRIGTEMRAQGFNFSHRGGKQQRPQPVQSASTASNIMPQQPPQNRAQSQTPINQARVQPPRAQAPTGPSQTNGAFTANGTTAPAATLPSNGAPTSETPKPGEVPKQAGSPQQESSKGIFISNVFNLNSAEEIKSQLFSPEDAAKITNVEKTAKGPWIAYFETSDIMHEVLRRGAPKEAQEKHKNLRMAPYRPARGGFGAAGTWQSSRGGAPGRGGAPSGEQRGGYQSAGGATTGSDSESGRGGRGRGRGGFRGDRGRGGRGGRGGERGGKIDGAPTSTPAPAPAGGDS